MIKLLNLH